MKRTYGISLICFFLASVLMASALPTMAGCLKSYNGKTGVLVLELEDKSTRKFVLTDKTKCEWMGRNTSPGALRQGAKISIQIAGALNASPLKAAKIVDWGNSEKIVAKGAASPYYTPVAGYASTGGGGGVPDGSPTFHDSAHQNMAAIAHGGSQNQEHGPAAGDHTNPTSSHSTNTLSTSPSHNGGPTHYSNQAESHMAPLEMMNIDPYSNSSYTQMGSANDVGTMMGVDSDESGISAPPGMETAYGGATEKITGQILESKLEQGWLTVQSFEHPNLIRVLLHEAVNAPMQVLTPGQMIEITGVNTPQGFKAREVKPAGGTF